MKHEDFLSTLMHVLVSCMSTENLHISQTLFWLIIKYASFTCCPNMSFNLNVFFQMYHSCPFILQVLSKSEGIFYLPKYFIQFICISSNISYPYFKCSFIQRVLSKSEWLIFFPSIHFCATTSQLHGFPVISISLSWWSQRSLWCFRIWYILYKKEVVHIT